MKADEGKSFLHITPAGTLVEIPNMRNAFDEWEDIIKFLEGYINKDYLQMIDICRKNVKEFDDLCFIYNSEDIVKIFIEWAADSSQVKES